MKTGVHIRSASTADASAMSELMHSLKPFMAEGGELPETLLNEMSEGAFCARIGDALYTSFIAECDHEVCGFLSLKSDDYLFHLFVAEAFHRRGVASQLWRHAIAATHAPAIRLRSSLYAVKAYRHMGFELDGKEGRFEGYRFQPMIWWR